MTYKLNNVGLPLELYKMLSCIHKVHSRLYCIQYMRKLALVRFILLYLFLIQYHCKGRIHILEYVEFITKLSIFYKFS